MMNARARWSLSTVPVLLALGCSDPVPFPAEGGATLSIQSPSSGVSGTSCPVPGRTYEIGNPAPTQSGPGESAIDGDKGASVKCSVKGNGPFTFSGTLNARNNEDKTPVSITFVDGQVGADKNSGTVSVIVSTLDLSSPFSSAAGACTVNVINQQIKPGSIWATFSCPSITTPPSGRCTIGGNSVFVFENCEGT